METVSREVCHPHDPHFPLSIDSGQFLRSNENIILDKISRRHLVILTRVLMFPIITFFRRAPTLAQSCRALQEQ